MFKTYLAVARTVRRSAEERAMGAENKRYTLVDISDPTKPQHLAKGGFWSEEEMLKWITWQVTTDQFAHICHKNAYAAWAPGGYYIVEGEKPELTERNGPAIEKVLAKLTIIEAS